MIDRSRLPTFFIPHGGGPCFFIKPEDLPPSMPASMWRPMERYLRAIDKMVGRKPRAVLVVSAHWMTPSPTIGNAGQHHLYYDYYDFPPYTYELKYPVTGAPDVAARVAELLNNEGIQSSFDDLRGIDHGVFVPFKLIYPDADVPIVPLSLQLDLDAAAHVAIGAALAPLRDEDVLIVGSGMSFHNLRAMMMGTPVPGSEGFDIWLNETVMAKQAERDLALIEWQNATGAREAHPEEEHLLPLMVAAGAAGKDRGRRTFSDKLGPAFVSGFTFG